MDFWRENVDNILTSNGLNLLKSKGSIGNKQMESIVEKVYDQFDEKRKCHEALLADNQDIEELLDLEQKIKIRK